MQNPNKNAGPATTAVPVKNLSEINLPFLKLFLLFFFLKPSRFTFAVSRFLRTGDERRLCRAPKQKRMNEKN